MGTGDTVSHKPRQKLLKIILSYRPLDGMAEHFLRFGKEGDLRYRLLARGAPNNLLSPM